MQDTLEDAKDAVTGAPDALADSATGSAVDSFAAAISDAMEWVIEHSLSWWVDKASLTGNSNSLIEQIRGWTLWLALAIAVGGIIYQGAKMALTAKPDPLMDVGRGLFNMALWYAFGIVGPIAAMKAGDKFSTFTLKEATDGNFSESFTKAFGLGGVGSAGALILLGILAFFAMLVQAFVMLLREGAVLALSGALVLAASGSFMQASSDWLRKVLSWLLALICYKPAAALIYSVGFLLIKEAGDKDSRTAFVGFAMLALSLIALPAMMKLFSWGVGNLESRGSGLSTGVAAGAALVHATTSVSGAADHARYMTQTLGPSTTTGSTDTAPPAALAAPSGADTAARGSPGMQVSAANAPSPSSQPESRSAPAAGAETTSAPPPPPPPPTPRRGGEGS